MRKLSLRSIFHILNSKISYFRATVLNHVSGPITKEVIGEFLPKIFHHSLALKNPYLFKPPYNSWLNYASFEVPERNDSFLIRYGNDLCWGWKRQSKPEECSIWGMEGWCGEGRWVQCMSFDTVVSKNKNKQYMWTKPLLKSKNECTDLVPRNAIMERQLWTRNSFVFAMARDGAGNAVLGFEKCCTHTCFR